MTDLKLPFEPRSFRDFMLFEKHAIDASRGYARRFMPRAFRLATAFEKATGRTFPAFKPKPLWYRQPIYYMGNHLNFVASGTPIAAPTYTKALDYELELGFVLGTPLRDASPEEAVSAIESFVVVCDFTARDVQKSEMESGFGPQKSKHFLSSMSAVAVPAAGILPRIEQLTGTVEIDGRLAARCYTSGMRYSLGEVLAHASRGEQLHRGELFATGTLAGGSALENGHWLHSGSRLRLTIDAIGEITHDIL